jgi:hypothetical protein
MYKLGKKTTTSSTCEHAKQELESGKEITKVYEIVEDEMQKRWRFVGSTKRQYLIDVKKILTNQYVLVM